MKESKLQFVIEAEEVERLQRASGLSLEDFLATLVKPTQALARAPISNFNVGAVGLGASGRVFRGVNVEFEGVPLNNSIHAEQFLVANAARNGERRLKFLAVSAAPCGHCRQFLQELRGASDLRVLIADSKAETHSLSHFLPHRFGPQDLLHEDFPLLLESQVNDLYLSSQVAAVAVLGKAGRHSSLQSESNATESANLFQGGMNGSSGPTEQRLQEFPGEQQLSELQNLALEAANNSYAPYTNCPSGLSIWTTKGRFFKGSYYESAAYNPSLPPLQAAIVAFIADGGDQFDEILHVAFVEKEGAAIRQADTVKLVLGKIAPKASITVIEAQVRNGHIISLTIVANRFGHFQVGGYLSLAAFCSIGSHTNDWGSTTELSWFLPLLYHAKLVLEGMPRSKKTSRHSHPLLLAPSVMTKRPVLCSRKNELSFQQIEGRAMSQLESSPYQLQDSNQCLARESLNLPLPPAWRAMPSYVVQSASFIL
ncbi:hypothetical protein R1sor_024017 [Riccia sorocarpa]|uniref:cytidine deaminase n=1 Tax=Riccia sorocarpa TaxID=122646 RepID=A0ABD3GR52_9MARC